MAEPARQEPPARPPFTPPPTVTGAGSTAATVAATAAPATVASIGLGATAGQTLDEALEALRRFFRAVRVRNDEWLRTTMRTASPSDIADAVAEESARQQAFEDKAHLRFREAMVKALAKGTAAERAHAVRVATDAERRYATMRQDMVARRSVAAVDRQALRRLSPQGPLWRLDESLATHTPDCVALAGHVWPWQALDQFRMWPPLHGRCGCSLHPYLTSVRRGWVRPGATMDVETALRRLTAIQAMREGEETTLPLAEALVNAGLTTLEIFSERLADLVKETS